MPVSESMPASRAAGTRSPPAHRKSQQQHPQGRPKPPTSPAADPDNQRPEDLNIQQKPTLLKVGASPQ